MKYLIEGFGIVAGCALVSLGWANMKEVADPKRRSSLRTGPVTMTIGSLVLTGLGTSLLLAVFAAWEGK